jgi:dCMP deaminase
MLRIAAVLSHRSTCARARVGAVVTDHEQLQILGIGYNGAARGLINGCASNLPGMCGCVHAELNALLKAPGALATKWLFTTHSPCVNCARAIANGGIAHVVYLEAYRIPAGLELLSAAGVTHEHFRDPLASALLADDQLHIYRAAELARLRQSD